MPKQVKPLGPVDYNEQSSRPPAPLRDIDPRELRVLENTLSDHVRTSNESPSPEEVPRLLAMAELTGSLTWDEMQTVAAFLAGIISKPEHKVDEYLVAHALNAWQKEMRRQFEDPPETSSPGAQTLTADELREESLGPQ